VLRYAAACAAAWGAQLLIAHAVPEMSEAMLLLYGLDDTGSIEVRPQVAHRRVAQMAVPIRTPYEVETPVGDVAPALRKLAKRWGADLLIVGRGRGNAQQGLGANIGDIVVGSPCPVLTYTGASRRPRPNGHRAYHFPCPETFAEAFRPVAFLPR
jgi:nucleotide-binding universal stress UspA family protein